jgi:hypothetical protein
VNVAGLYGLTSVSTYTANVLLVQDFHVVMPNSCHHMAVKPGALTRKQSTLFETDLASTTRQELGKQERQNSDAQNLSTKPPTLRDPRLSQSTHTTDCFVILK